MTTELAMTTTTRMTELVSTIERAVQNMVYA